MKRDNCAQIKQLHKVHVLEIKETGEIFQRVASFILHAGSLTLNSAPVTRATLETSRICTSSTAAAARVVTGSGVWFRLSGARKPVLPARIGCARSWENGGNMQETDGAGAFGASLAGRGFDFHKFARQPQTIVRFFSWVSACRTKVEGWSRLSMRSVSRCARKLPVWERRAG